MKKLKKYVPYAAAVLVLALAAAMLTGCFSSMLMLNRTEDTPVRSENDEDAAYMAKLEEIIALLDEKYIDGYDKEHLDDYLAEAAVAATGDRWSYYISAEDMAAYTQDKNNAYVGIGITIHLDDDPSDGMGIQEVAPNGPAAAAGLQPGDVILEIDGQLISEVGIDGAGDLIRGEEGTDVVLKLLRDGVTSEITVTRAVVEVEVVQYELLSGGEGYIKIVNFNEHCARDTIAAMEALMEQGAKGLIFDVRFNPGGYKTELVELLDYILPEGPLFRSVDYTGEENVDYSDDDCIEIPMAVLVNGDSYSAAEFFAVALQEYGVATVVGTQTVGKANFQSTYMLSDGSAVAVSVGHYQTPNGVTLEGIGVTPDLVVEVDEATYIAIYNEQLEITEDLQIQAAISALAE